MNPSIASTDAPTRRTSEAAVVPPRPSGSAAGDYGREESEAQRLDRNWSELVQELRVIGTGVQILFAFLLIIAFQARFGQTTPFRTRRLPRDPRTVRAVRKPSHHARGHPPVLLPHSRQGRVGGADQPVGDCGARSPVTLHGWSDRSHLRRERGPTWCWDLRGSRRHHVRNSLVPRTHLAPRSGRQRATIRH